MRGRQGDPLPRNPNAPAPRAPASNHGIPGWEDLSHSGLLLDAARLAELAVHAPEPLDGYIEDKLRRRATALLDGEAGEGAEVSRLVAFVLEEVCGFGAATGVWQRGSNVPAAEGRSTLDWAVRQRMSGTHLNWHVAQALAVAPPESAPRQLVDWQARIALPSIQFAPDWLRFSDGAALHPPTAAERLRIAVMIDAAAAAIMGLSEFHLRYALSACDYPANYAGSRLPKGFWRVDKDKDPELRHTVLTLIAFHDLQTHIASAGDQHVGIEAFLTQNAGDGWQLPETLRLADYDLGHDDRAQYPQPVAGRLGPRFYERQLAQPADEAQHESRLNSRNLLGELDYARLLRELDGPHGQRDDERLPEVAEQRRSTS